jgi:hypothetical protein
MLDERQEVLIVLLVLAGDVQITKMNPTHYVAVHSGRHRSFPQCADS